MAALTWFATSALASVHQEMSETDPGTEVTATGPVGWIAGNATNNHSPLKAGAEQALATFTATTDPDGTIDTTNGDCFRSTNTYTGSFANANWEVRFAARATTATGCSGRIRCRLLRSANANGSGATEITSGQQIASTSVSSLQTGTTQTTTATFNPGAFSVSNEYIFIQLAWERTGAGGHNTSDVNMRVGNASSAGTRVVSSNFTIAHAGSATFAPAGGLTVSAAMRIALTPPAMAGAGGLTVDADFPARAIVSYAAIEYTLAATAHAGSATFAGAGSLTANAYPDWYAYVSFAAVRYTTAAPHVGEATFAGAGGFSADAVHQLQVRATFQGAGSLTAAATQAHQIAATFAGAGNLTATAALRLPASATFAGAGSLAANGVVVKIGEAAFAGTGALTATAAQRLAASVRFDGAGALSATAQQRLRATATFAGAGALSATAQQNLVATATFAGAGSLTANALQTHQLSSAFAGSGAFAADAVLLNFVNLEATFQGAGGLTAASSTNMVAAATFAGTGAFAADALGYTFATASFDGAGGLVSYERLYLNVSAQFDGTGSLTADAVIAGPAVLPVNIIKPLVTGTAAVGQLLSCTTGAWAGPPTSYSYQWRHLVTSGGLPVVIDNDYVGVPIAGATSNTYTLVEADAGEQIFCDVTATNTVGSSPPESSNLTAAVFTNSISATFAGSGALSAQTTATTNIQATFGGAGALTATIPGAISASAVFGGAGGLSADLQDTVDRAVISYASVQFATTGALSASAIFAGAGNLAAQAEVVTPGIHQGAATFQVAGSLTATVTARLVARATFAGAGQLQAQAGEPEQLRAIIAWAALSYQPQTFQDITSTEVLHKPINAVLHGQQTSFKTTKFSGSALRRVFAESKPKRRPVPPDTGARTIVSKGARRPPRIDIFNERKKK
jgi:hypothetical protein